MDRNRGDLTFLTSTLSLTTTQRSTIATFSVTVCLAVFPARLVTLPLRPGLRSDGRVRCSEMDRSRGNPTLLTSPIALPTT